MSCSQQRARTPTCPAAPSTPCQTRWDDAFRQDTACLPPLFRRLEGIIRRSGWSLGGQLSSDVLEECRQEMLVLLWRVRHKLQALPPAEQEAYAVACVSYASRRFLRRERRHSARSG